VTGRQNEEIVKDPNVRIEGKMTTPGRVQLVGLGPNCDEVGEPLESGVSDDVWFIETTLPAQGMNCLRFEGTALNEKKVTNEIRLNWTPDPGRGIDPLTGDPRRDVITVDPRTTTPDNGSTDLGDLDFGNTPPPPPPPDPCASVTPTLASIATYWTMYWGRSGTDLTYYEGLGWDIHFGNYVNDGGCGYELSVTRGSLSPDIPVYRSSSCGCAITYDLSYVNYTGCYDDSFQLTITNPSYRSQTMSYDIGLKVC
jgi:hypothetical protein